MGLFFVSPGSVTRKWLGSVYIENTFCLTDPGDTKNNPTFIYLDAFAKDEHFAAYAPEYASLDEMKAHYERGGLGDMKVKKLLNAVMQETLEPIRAKRRELEKDIPAVWEMLYKGSREAKAKAAETLDEVKKAMKIDYFVGR